MRDDFTKAVKEVLYQRVGLLCSNPNCMRLTFGPNSNTNKSVNIGVAAHITAASVGGPRFDSKISSEERSSAQNGIWLCQSCAKLIDSDEKKYTKELLLSWKKAAEDYAELLLTQNQMSFNKYHSILQQIPNLIGEMADDLSNDPIAREFVLLGKNWAYNDKRGVLKYYFEDHENLEKKIRLLENNGLVNDITFNNTKRYVFTEEFVSILTKLN